ncbi:glycosyltransferase family 4 protein [Agarivorans sp. Alg241-V36]|uniref:glycosyltransferase family 4 protein n=1 Tax=Agarivorans sp. Alg241-V36 TaxID=2305992 RepID=UPI0013D52068|nr:glycosyltransferase family 4 protein [Agarivorans sp. Alg241-V36]
MKVLIVNTSDINGGAARAAYRLHQALLAQEIDCKMLVQNKKSDDYTVVGPVSLYEKVLSKLRPFFDALPCLFIENKASTLFSNSWLPSGKIIQKINSMKPDIVHLHWVNDGMIRVEDLKKINAPIVWSLHDAWPLSGGWHYEETQVSNAQRKLDIKIFNRKKKTYSKIENMSIVGLSRWIQDCANNSPAFNGKKIINLPNPINTEIYKPIDKKVSRQLWGLPEDKKLVLFGAIAATSDPRKGFKELSDALSKLNRSDIEFVVFGSSKPLTPPDLGCKVHYVGMLSDDVSLVSLYSAVDVMVVPSLQENLSNAIMESLSCATPVVGFDIGGNSDLIEHKVNGYLAQELNTKDLAFGIEWCLDNSNYEMLSSRGREKVLKYFDSKVVAKKYVEVYKSKLCKG